MKTVLLVLALVTAACADDVEPGVPDEYAQYCAERGPTFCAEVGESCESESFCDGGSAWCHAGRCEPFCSPVDYPLCSSGTETWVRVERSAVCVCVQ